MSLGRDVVSFDLATHEPGEEPRGVAAAEFEDDEVGREALLEKRDRGIVHPRDRTAVRPHGLLQSHGEQVAGGAQERALRVEQAETLAEYEPARNDSAQCIAQLLQARIQSAGHEVRRAASREFSLVAWPNGIARMRGRPQNATLLALHRRLNERPRDADHGITPWRI